VIDDNNEVSKESFDVKLLNLQEICPVNIPDCITIDLLELEYQVDSSTLPELLEYNSQDKYYYYEYSSGNELIPSVNYTIPGFGKFIFQIFPHDTLLPSVQYYRKGEEFMLGGSVKFSMFLGGWNFVSTDSILRLSADISVVDGMYECTLTNPLLKDDEFILNCNSTELSGTLNLMNYGASLNQLLSPIPEIINVTVSKIDIPLADNFSSEPVKSNKCDYDNNRDTLRLQSIIIQLDTPYFTGSLIYDPQISVLLGVGGSDNNGNGCDSSQSIQLGLIISTVVLLGVGVYVIILVSLLSMIRPFDKIIYGKEGSRVAQCRRSERRAQMDTIRDSVNSGTIE